jgi:hypothetical protein
MRKLSRTLLALLLASAATVFAQSVAFVTNLKGDVAIDGNQRPLVLAELAKGQRITVGRDALLHVMYTASGKEYVLKPGEYEIRDTEVASASGMPPIARSTEWRASNKVLTQIGQTSSASVRMRSLAKPKVDNAPRLLFPTDGNVSTLQPEFRWHAADASAPGELTLVISGQAKPVHHAKVTGLAYRANAKLKPDTEYAWVVATNGVEIGTGKFRTLPASAIQAIDKKRPTEKSEFSDRLLFALYLQEMGATQEAREAWMRLSQERADLPELSALAK